MKWLLSLVMVGVIGCMLIKKLKDVLLFINILNIYFSII